MMRLACNGAAEWAVFNARPWFFEVSKSWSGMIIRKRANRERAGSAKFLAKRFLCQYLNIITKGINLHSTNVVAPIFLLSMFSWVWGRQIIWRARFLLLCFEIVGHLVQSSNFFSDLRSSQSSRSFHVCYHNHHPMAPQLHYIIRVGENFSRHCLRNLALISFIG